MRFLLLSIFAILSCNGSSFNGSNGSHETPPQALSTPLPEAATASVSQQYMQTVPTPFPTVIPTTFRPDSVVDGEEVINECGRCMARAQELSATIGFKAIIENTVNEGYYKIDPRQGLCDIHFLKDPSVPISDHEGASSSVLDRQVALYCPCTCGWKMFPGEGYY